MTLEVHFEDGTTSRYPETMADAIRIISEKYGTCITHETWHRTGDHETLLAYDDVECSMPVAEIVRR